MVVIENFILYGITEKKFSSLEFGLGMLIQKILRSLM